MKALKQTYTQGQFFGGASLFKDAAPRPGKAVEAVAAQPTLLACISEANFPRLLTVDASIQKQLLLEAKRRLLFSYRATRVPFFCEITDANLTKFAEMSQLMPLKANEAIDCDTESSRGLYIVADGEITASVTGKHSEHNSISTLRYGQYFGELGLMLPSAPLNTSYCASGSGEATLLVLPKFAFLLLFGKDRSLLAELRMKVHQQSASLMTVLEHRRARALFMEHLRRTGGNGSEAPELPGRGCCW